VSQTAQFPCYGRQSHLRRANLRREVLREDQEAHSPIRRIS